ncbi:MAG TPA: class III extradiol ring-cleavage dioxygenase [Acidiphilium sp.]|uniref:DODA-type extradiol aromatic ring-opening family dioxygenase n=1 Tax=unclassified Acidiphilium TaxID=2617493 RepID=UPI000BD97D43|nr:MULTISPECIES: class III extradiol ring-cleavage dioxygenase [unclassified Acidiphilium]OYV56727.1 MAG: dioxygenase [Acidiphilium sp. 20-67-58]OYV85087.1 MAG: dioxygenase [Acidiphilium sp. 21-68-69]HQT60889.1 class III extradiol ring-cleavage dioxygenase [Acidiphilium sp.]HQU12000.1 class III extradiol ring-cleavage dioxygenase [Acidiphilium sp.]
MQPALFVSHGSPMLALTETPARSFLAGLSATLPRPRAILVVSAHWETDAPMVNAVERNGTIHDFFGFPRALYQLAYPAPGDAALAQRIAALLGEAGFPTGLDPKRGLDHGAWVPLLLAYPAADIPVLQLSVQTRLGPRHAFDIGRALAPLRREDVLIVGSGSFTHDLRRFRGQPVDAPETEDVTAFSAWMDEAIAGNDIAALLDYRARAPHARDEHPTEEHLLPLFTAIGAGEGDAARRLHNSTEHAILRMDAYGFGLPA